MRKILITTCCWLLCTLAVGQIRVITIGDSTMANYDEEEYSGAREQRGWGQLFSLYLKDGVVLNNEARNGRSSKSFYYERWSEIKENIHHGDYMIIQFGHNDEKNDGVDTSEEEPKARGTNPWGQYQKYLSLYVHDVRSKGGVPILATPVVRRMMKNGKIEPKGRHSLAQFCNGNDSILNYPLAMKQVAEALNVPLIDMTTLTQELVESFGAEKAAELIYINTDKTHLKEEGARLFAELMRDALKEEGIMLEALK